MLCRHLLALQPSECADLGATQEMHARPAVLAAGDVVTALAEVEHVPAKGTELAGPQPVPEGNQDHGGVAVRGAGADALLRTGNEALHLLGGEVLPRTSLGSPSPILATVPMEDRGQATICQEQHTKLQEKRNGYRFYNLK